MSNDTDPLNKITHGPDVYPFLQLLAELCHRNLGLESLELRSTVRLEHVIPDPSMVSFVVFNSL
ncbi:hypothetical protein SNOG_12747 [Parastagonospora nodorum SN15]|uniref:Uncharacterized protein n=1 Tax=Phaeosphaeria nodorum (strain SN15 / ATCC MYA-4574 / FGSC 10173) TaxID=321614 RepID=Q0U667_PHANO|nr:hypothetical protein SNOG_12747 [Parastagonospora nodorum SN15]EAT80045.1 hypothetical protein SNOG_12747 [Parastagonospora nodorum SN15]